MSAQSKAVEYLSSPHVERLMRAGLDAYRAGRKLDACPYEPSFESYWWRKGWEAAAVVDHFGALS